jgi:hypothetical protein
MDKAVGEAVSWWLLTAEAGVCPQGSSCGICGRQESTGTSIFIILGFFTCQSSFHGFSVFTDLTPEGWTMVPLKASVLYLSPTI